MSEPPKRNPLRRLKMMMRHTWLIVTASLLMCAGIGGVAYYFLNLPTQWKIAVGPPNSDDLKVINVIAANLARDRASIRLRVIVKDGGTREAARAIDTGEADLAVVRRDIGMSQEGQAIAIFRKNVAVFVVPPPAKAAPVAAKGRAARRKAAAAKPAKIEKIEELVGKRLAIVGRSPSNLALLKVILGQYNIRDDKIALLDAEAEKKPNAKDKINIIQLDPRNVTSDIRDRKPDAILSVGPLSSDITAAVIAAASRDKEPPTFLDIGTSEAIAERYPVYESIEIKAGTFGGSPPRPEETVETIGVNHYIVARKKLDEDTVAHFSRLLFTMRNAIGADAPTNVKIEAPDTDKDASVPVHPGAAAYIDGDVKTFFDRYSDLLYWGLMVFSFLGSALAGLATYAKSDGRSQRLKVLEQLLEIGKQARTAEIDAADRRLAGRDRRDPGPDDPRRRKQRPRRGGANGLQDLARPGPIRDFRPPGRAPGAAAADPTGGRRALGLMPRDGTRNGCYPAVRGYIAPQQGGPRRARA